MCGIIGIAAAEPVADRGRLAAARDAMTHRGPDDSGEWWSSDGRVGFGHRRLAIIDLTATGHQPMQDAHGEVVIDYNGEMYNFRELRCELAERGHRFTSQSDTEVILAAYREWGAECLNQLDGMFAFALFDARRNEILLARDRAGEKPLFYANVRKRLIFASELKALMAFEPALRSVDPEALDCYLGLGYVPGERCIISGIRKLPPAHAITFDVDKGAMQTWRYWQLPSEPSAPSDGHMSSLAEELESILERAVARQLVADVPVGVLLSGGLDSSMVTAMASRATSRLSTFTIRFPGHDALDETEHARRVARHFDTDHVELAASEATPSLLPMLAKQYDEPLIDSSMIPTYLVSHLVRSKCTVALGGDGGDELFGGYQHYDRLASLAARTRWMPTALRRSVSAAAVGILPVGAKGRNWAAALGTDLANDVPLIASYFDRETRTRLIPALAQVETRCERVWFSRTSSGGDLIQRVTRTDFHNYLPEDILVKVDRASMLNSLEVRAPFLDRSVIEFAFGRVPSSMKVAGGRRKLLLGDLAARVLPPDVDRNRKQGFCIPLGAWLEAGPWESFFRSVLLGADQSVFERKAVERIWEGQRRGRQNGERLFGLVMFELWRREYGVRMP